MSLFPFVLSSSSSILQFMLLLYVLWRYVKIVNTDKGHDEQLKVLDDRSVRMALMVGVLKETRLEASVLSSPRFPCVFRAI